MYHFTFPPESIRLPVSLYPHQNLLFSMFCFCFDRSHPVCVKWYLIMVWIYIFLMTNDCKHLFMGYGLFISVFIEMSIQVLCLLLNWVVFLFSSLCSLHIKLLSDKWFINIFFLSLGFLLTIMIFLWYCPIVCESFWFWSLFFLFFLSFLMILVSYLRMMANWRS